MLVTSFDRPAALFLLGGASLALAGCGGGDSGGSGAANTTAGAPAPTAPAGAAPTAAAAAPTLADGPDVCFRAVARQLGANTRVSEITSFFSVGTDIDASSTRPQGEMTTCTVQYQSPTDPRKLVEISRDPTSGTFGAPRPIEITVMGGNEASFKLDDYLIPLSQVNAAALTAVMDAQKAKLSGIYSRYAWSGVRLQAPGAFSDKHTLRLDIVGRLAANDIKKDGYASVTLDGRTITTNFLTP